VCNFSAKCELRTSELYKQDSRNHHLVHETAPAQNFWSLINSIMYLILLRKAVSYVPHNTPYKLSRHVKNLINFGFYKAGLQCKTKPSSRLPRFILQKCHNTQNSIQGIMYIIKSGRTLVGCNHS
jgi:hypothetical protein